MIKPLENETQPQFAIRFHESMTGEIPDTVKRNRACFAAWDEHRGEDPTIAELVESRFKIDEYKRLPNVALFHEHTVPGQVITLPDGSEKELPPQKYGRDELAEMVEGMNERILDHDEFSPITRGHTSEKKDGQPGERQFPEVLGFAGPYRLGMIGRKKPRYAIFGTEYHLNEHSSELKKRVGRSPEVWRYSRCRDRFFYPVAALAEEMPRLNLPPAHYARSSSGEVFVQCYQAVFPGGTNAFVPSFKASTDGRKPMADKYSADQSSMSQLPGGESAFSEGSVGKSQLEELIGALFETQPFQFLFSLMRQAGISGNTDPAVPPAIQQDPNSIPDPGAPAQGAPVQGSPGGAPTDGPNPAAPAPPSLAQTPPNQASPSPPAVNGPPKMGNNPMSQNQNQSPASQNAQGAQGIQIPPKKDNYSRSVEDLAVENDQLREALDKVLARLGETQKEKTATERYSRLSELAKNYRLDPQKELQRVEHYSAEGFEGHCELIRENYQRTITNTPDFASMSDGDNRVMEPARSAAALSPEELSQVERYCIEHDKTFFEGKEIYLRERSKSSAV